MSPPAFAREIGNNIIAGDRSSVSRAADCARRACAVEHKPIDASSAGDRVGTTAASDRVVVCASRDGEALGLTRERDGDPRPCRGRRDRLHALDRSVRRAQRVEVRRSRSQIDGVCASAEIDRAGANNDRVELRASERFVTTGAGEVPGRDIADRRRCCGRNVPARHHIQDIGSAAKIDRVEARPLVGGHRDRVVTAAASQRFDVADRASREIDCRRVGENNRVRISATVNRLARGKIHWRG